MKMRKTAAFLLAGIAMAGLIGCGNAKQQEKSTSVEGLSELGKITVVSREEGSGTRSTFSQLLDFQDNEEGKADLTTEDAIITESSEGVIDLVESDSAGIGYLSMGTQDLDKVKVLSVNGISADANDSKYPLTRGFYLAYSGKLSELEQDFMIYIHGAGQEIVGKSYAQIAKSSTFLSNQAKGTIAIGGSSSVYPLIKELLDYEMIARDGIAVVVNKENPLTDISSEQLKQIYTGDKKEWGSLNE